MNHRINKRACLIKFNIIRMRVDFVIGQSIFMQCLGKNNGKTRSNFNIIILHHQITISNTFLESVPSKNCFYFRLSFFSSTNTEFNQDFYLPLRFKKNKYH